MPIRPDAIPIHLATEEAMEIYKDKLAPQGAVVMHVSNRHLELASVVVGIADANDLKSWVYSEDSSRDGEYIFSTSVVVSRARGGRCRQARIVRTMGADGSRRDTSGSGPTTIPTSLGAVWRRLRDGEQ